jgi:CRP-like cAMP-binding protein
MTSPRLRRAAPAPSTRPPLQNRILAALPSADLERLRPHLTPLTLELKHVFWEPNREIPHLYFPIDMVGSVLALTDSGMVEVGTVGNEGLIGLPVYLGARSSPGRALAQVPGRAERMEVADFQREIGRGGALRDVLQRYTLGFMTQVSQTTACNRTHSAEQRLARWLLLVHDRVQRDQFPLTQEFMAQMLGVRRATVSETAGALQQAGLIAYRRGMLTLRKRAGLEEVACECYRVVRQEFERLLGVSMG